MQCTVFGVAIDFVSSWLFWCTIGCGLQYLWYESQAANLCYIAIVPGCKNAITRQLPRRRKGGNRPKPLFAAWLMWCQRTSDARKFKCRYGPTPTRESLRDDTKYQLLAPVDSFARAEELQSPRWLFGLKTWWTPSPLDKPWRCRRYGRVFCCMTGILIPMPLAFH